MAAPQRLAAPLVVAPAGGPPVTGSLHPEGPSFGLSVTSTPHPPSTVSHGFEFSPVCFQQQQLLCAAEPAPWGEAGEPRMGSTDSSMAAACAPAGEGNQSATPHFIVDLALHGGGGAKAQAPIYRGGRGAAAAAVRAAEAVLWRRQRWQLAMMI